MLQVAEIALTSLGLGLDLKATFKYCKLGPRDRLEHEHNQTNGN